MHNIFFSRFGIFENLTVFFYGCAFVLISSKLREMRKNIFEFLNIKIAVFLVASSLVLLLEESLTGIFGWLAVVLFKTPPSDAGLMVISLISIARIMATGLVIFAFFRLWEKSEAFRRDPKYLFKRPSLPFWAIFVILITVSAFSSMDMAPAYVSRIEEALEMNAALSWLTGNIIVFEGLHEKCFSGNNKSFKPGGKKKNTGSPLINRLLDFLKAE